MGIVIFLVKRDRGRFFLPLNFACHIFIGKCDGKRNGKSNDFDHASLKM